MISELTSAQTDVAAELVGKAGLERPLDQVLRTEFRRRTGLARTDSGRITAAALAYFRWLRWLDERVSLSQQVAAAWQLDSDFRDAPRRFSDRDLIERAVPEWARETMDCSAPFVRALQRSPTLWLRARPGQAQALAERLFHAAANPSKWKDAVRYEGADDLFRDPGFQAGDFEIQDINSQAIGWLCNPRPQETWWDACAGEGGKTLHLSDLMQNRGAIWATDNAAWRLELLRRRAARARAFNYRSRVWPDCTRLPFKTLFDGVLVDAPCSGIGTWHRNPQARWTTKPDSLKRLASLQSDLLDAVARSVKPGGRLIYAVCTLSRKETTEVAHDFAAAHPEFSPEETIHPWTGSKASEHWFWPQENEGNGMFAAAWKKSRD